MQCFAGFVLAQSVGGSELVEVPVAYQVVSEATGVPVDILFAVALAESAKSHNSQLLPWPWALNIDGQSVYCSSLDEAITQSRRAIHNHQAIDLGLMQISWRWHRQRFHDPGQALIPIQNLKAGAMILREQYDATGNWWEAVGRYHDPGEDDDSLKNAEHYRARVRQHWEGVF